MPLIIFATIIILILLILYFGYKYSEIKDNEKIEIQENYYNKNTYGYYYNGELFKLLKAALKRDKDVGSLEMAKNAKLIGDIYNYQLNNGIVARKYYNIALNRLNAYQKKIAGRINKSNMLNFNTQIGDNSNLVIGNNSNLDILNATKVKKILNDYVEKDNKETLHIVDEIEKGLNSDNMKIIENQNFTNNNQQHTLEEQQVILNDILAQLQPLRREANLNTHNAIRLNRQIERMQQNNQIVHDTEQIDPNYIELRNINGNNVPLGTRNERPVTVRTVQTIKHSKDLSNEHYRPVIKSDSQNVHDSEISHEIKQKYNRIKFLNNLAGYNSSLAPQSVNSLNDVFQKYYDLEDILRQEKLQKARFVVGKMLSNNHENSNLNDTEQNVLSQVWGRINSRDNSAKYPELVTSLVDQLADCSVGHSFTVCESGRINRMIDSLSMLDNDQSIAQPLMSKEMLRAQILPNVSLILRQEIERLPEDVRNDYNTGNETEDVKTFENRMKNKISEMIDEDYPSVSPGVKEQIKEEAYAGI